MECVKKHFGIICYVLKDSMLWNFNVCKGLSFLTEVLILGLHYSYFCNLQLRLKAKKKVKSIKSLTKCFIYFSVCCFFFFFPQQKLARFSSLIRRMFNFQRAENKHFISEQTYQNKGQIFSSSSFPFCPPQKQDRMWFLKISY